MAERVPVIAETRRALRDAVLDQLVDRVGEHIQQVNGGPWDGVPVVTEKAWIDAVAEQRAEPVPAPLENSAELSTPGTIFFSAVCPKCSGRANIRLNVDSELVVDWHTGSLRLKAKAKPVTHVCGQTTVEEAIAKADVAEGQFELEDILGTDADSATGQGLVEEPPEQEPPAPAPESNPTTIEEARDILDALPGTAPADVPPGEELCPYPGCVREPEHRGKHRIEEDGQADG